MLVFLYRLLLLNFIPSFQSRQAEKLLSMDHVPKIIVSKVTEFGTSDESTDVAN